MKKSILSMVMFCLVLMLGFCIPTEIKAQTAKTISLNTETFPDAWVLDLAREYDKDNNGVLSQDEINAITKISGNKSITSFTEFEYFTNLKELDLGTRENTCPVSGTLDFTKFSNLEKIVLYRRGSDIEIKVAGLTSLKQLIIYNETPNEENDDLGHIDLHNTPVLEIVDIESAGSVIFDEHTAIRKLR